MNVRKALFGAGMGAILLTCGASASPVIDLGGYTGPIQFKFQNYESFTGTPLAVGSMNFGVVKITSIIDPTTGGTLWSPGGANGFLSGVFNGITVTSVNQMGPNNFITTNSGGVFNFYLTTTDFNPAQGTAGYVGCAVGGLCYNGITNVGGQNVLNLALVPGVTTDPTNTLNVSLTSNTLPTTGQASGFADITGGTDVSQFATGGFATNFAPADMHFLDDFCTNGQSGCTGPSSSDWELFSHDPVDAVIAPEPASLGLFASALFGFAAWARRRRR